MRDSFGREVDYLRLSVTEGCNMRCIYCRPGDSGDGSCCQLGRERCVEIARAAAELGVRKVRLTGGEPCVRADLADIVRGIAAIPGIEEVCLTTNGTLIAPMVAALKAAGLSRVNVSIDSLDPARYEKITRGGDLAQALAGLEAILAAGFENTKVNCVLMAGINDDEVEAFDAFGAEKGVEVRFIELMPLGPARDLTRGTVPSVAFVEDGKKNRPPCHQVIAPITHPFCSTCNRIRVTADGFAKPCLHSKDEISLKGLCGEALVAALREAILAKPAGHRLAQGASDAQRDMSRIGG